jgi:hypothetical protein
MPIHLKHDNKGSYYQWGRHSKYYFKTEIGKNRAYEKAHKQAIAAYANGYKE